ncbi:phosphotransferase [Paenibacillus oenotherae]|uniref:Phosphotransferase n=2 Tax=Paenibacillus oenotherae TaxID=1435645 RepID=A0ABS7D5R5_9BACL|nr:phosphotransferase [Paenibacillus oenotherae]MBW7475274.1 phosphotransferase [Paenibacillus oenotherae]
MSQELVSHIARQFGIKIVGHKQIRKGIFRIIAQNGRTYSLKRMPRPLARLKWIDRMLLRCNNKGLRLVWRNPQTSIGSKLYATSPKNELYVLTPWIAGRMPSPRSLGDMRACGIALGRLHTAGRDGLRGYFAYSQIRTWPQTLQARQRYLQNKIAKANRNGFGSTVINRFIQRHGKEFLRYAAESRALLRSSGYFSYRNHPRTHGVLCHGDGGPSNFIMNAKGTRLIDFETLHVDLRAYDLYRVIYNSCKDYQWDFRIARAILNGYRQVAKLSRTDYKLIRIWLRFPLSTYLVLSPFKRLPLTKQRLQWALSSERRIGTFLRNLDNYAARHS